MLYITICHIVPYLRENAKVWKVTFEFKAEHFHHLPCDLFEITSCNR